MVQEVVTLTHGLQTVIQNSITVVINLASMAESLQWATTLVHHTDLAVSTVTVSSTMTLLQLELHSSELLVFHMVLDSVGYVAVVGLFHTHMADKEV